MNPEALKHHRARLSANQRRYRERHREEIRARRFSEYYEKAQAKQRARYLWTKFGVTIAQYEELNSKQKGLCAICGRPETKEHKRSPDKTRHVIPRLSVDHSHETGIVRGLLCKSCNLALGYFSEDIATLKAAVQYLEAANGRVQEAT